MRFPHLKAGRCSIELDSGTVRAVSVEPKDVHEPNDDDVVVVETQDYLCPPIVIDSQGFPVADAPIVNAHDSIAAHTVERPKPIAAHTPEQPEPIPAHAQKQPTLIVGDTLEQLSDDVLDDDELMDLEGGANQPAPSFDDFPPETPSRYGYEYFGEELRAPWRPGRGDQFKLGKSRGTTCTLSGTGKASSPSTADAH